MNECSINYIAIPEVGIAITSYKMKMFNYTLNVWLWICVSYLCYLSWLLLPEYVAKLLPTSNNWIERL